MHKHGREHGKEGGATQVGDARQRKQQAHLMLVPLCNVFTPDRAALI
jgi:hypothetical protein